MRQASHNEILRAVESIETESRTVVARDQGPGTRVWGWAGMGSYCFVGRVSALQDEEFWRWTVAMAAQQSVLSATELYA